MALHKKYKKEMRTFWDSFDSPYQMGEQKHRVYLLDLLGKYGATSILDNGCGTAPIYEMIKNNPEKWNFDYKGTDYSFAMINIAKEQFPEGNFEVQDARKLREKDSSWDCVLLLHCLDHLDDYEAAIKEAYRVAKRYVCIVLWRGFVNDGTQLNDRNMMNKEEGDKPWEDTFLQEYSPQSLLKSFNDANLHIVEIATGDILNSEASKHNWLVLLKKGGVDNEE